MKNANKLIKAGGLITRDFKGQKQVLLISSDSRSWSFPKGHLEPNESLEAAAVRECEEETGYKTEILKKLPELEYTNNQTGQVIVVNFYQMKIVGGKLQKEFDDNHLEWFSFDNAQKIFDHQNLKDYMSLVKGSLV